jgi:undecaprenyl diphosphate synthase
LLALCFRLPECPQAEVTHQLSHGASALPDQRGSGIKVNLLVNYDWEWDMSGVRDGSIRSREVSKLDLIMR